MTEKISSFLYSEDTGILSVPIIQKLFKDSISSFKRCCLCSKCFAICLENKAKPTFHRYTNLEKLVKWVQQLHKA